MKPSATACVTVSAALVAAALAGLVPLASAGASDAGGSSGIVRSATTIEWGDCEAFSVTADECGYLSVPRNWSKPNGKKIRLAVSRVKATAPDSQYQGVMLVNPGGPGAPGLQYSSLQDAMPNDSGATYDWIGFDPRGVGESKPAISCDPDYQSRPRPNYVPVRNGTTLTEDTAGEKLTTNEKKWLKLSKRYAKTCGKYGKLLDHMRTADWIRDVDALRQALGVAKINYYGFSYGTYLGQAYATTYPNRVRRMVLDGNVDPRNVWYQGQLAQDRAFAKVADVFFGWVARYEGSYGLGGSADEVRKKYYAVLDGLTTKPQQGIDANAWTDVFVRAMYAEFLWPDAASAFAAWVHDRDMEQMKVAFEMAVESDDNLFAVYNAVQCTDNRWPRSYEKTWRPDAFEIAANAPMLTWSNVWFNTACLYWPGKARKPIRIDGGEAPPILLINATGDAATPFSGALEVRQRFPRSRLIAQQGATTHSGSLDGPGCVSERIADYLSTGALPGRKSGERADLVCDAVPKPTPGLLSFGPASPTPAPEPAPDPEAEQAALDLIVGLLPQRAH